MPALAAAGDRNVGATRMALPTTLLGRLAVDRGWQGQGIGGILLVHALRMAVTGADTIAAAVIEVDA